eukprot:811505-Alexandrium_andersonii.AAC.1
MDARVGASCAAAGPGEGTQPQACMAPWMPGCAWAGLHQARGRGLNPRPAWPQLNVSKDARVGARP